MGLSHYLEVKPCMGSSATCLWPPAALLRIVRIRSSFAPLFWLFDINAKAWKNVRVPTSGEKDPTEENVIRQNTIFDLFSSPENPVISLTHSSPFGLRAFLETSEWPIRGLEPSLLTNQRIHKIILLTNQRHYIGHPIHPSDQSVSRFPLMLWCFVGPYCTYINNS